MIWPREDLVICSQPVACCALKAMGAGGLGKPMTREDLMKMIGCNASDLPHANRLSLIDKVPGGTDEVIDEANNDRRRSEKAASLRVLKRLIKAGKLDLTAP